MFTKSKHLTNTRTHSQHKMNIKCWTNTKLLLYRYHYHHQCGFLLLTCVSTKFFCVVHILFHLLSSIVWIPCAVDLSENFGPITFLTSTKKKKNLVSHTLIDKVNLSLSHSHLQSVEYFLPTILVQLCLFFIQLYFQTKHVNLCILFSCAFEKKVIIKLDAKAAHGIGTIRIHAIYVATCTFTVHVVKYIFLLPLPVRQTQHSKIVRRNEPKTKINTRTNNGTTQ